MVVSPAVILVISVVKVATPSSSSSNMVITIYLMIAITLATVITPSLIPAIIIPSPTILHNITITLLQRCHSHHHCIDLRWIITQTPGIDAHLSSLLAVHHQPCHWSQ